MMVERQPPHGARARDEAEKNMAAAENDKRTLQTQLEEVKRELARVKVRIS